VSEREIEILGIAGSLREKSFNRALLDAAAMLLPPGATIARHDISGLPLYNADLDVEPALPVVAALKAAVRRADAVLIATPEYNFGIPGPLKNALDWASRPGFRSPFARKPVAIIGASGGAVGTARAQGQLKQVLLGLSAIPLPRAEFLAGNAPQKFDADGRLTDEPTRELLKAMLADFATFARGAIAGGIAPAGAR
jgi:chromate reductase